MDQMTEEAQKWWLTDEPINVPSDVPAASTYLQTHDQLPVTSSTSTNTNPQDADSQPPVIKFFRAPLRGPMEVEPSTAALLSMPAPAMPAAPTAPGSDENTEVNSQVNFFVHQQQSKSSK